MKYEDIKNLVKEELQIIEKKMISWTDVREPLQTTLIEFLKSPSKRVRSVLAILYHRAFTNKNLNEKQLDFLACVELIHNASLIHDDIIDESDKRRGKETLHKQFNTKLSILSGDYLLSLAFEKLSDLGLTKIFSTTLKYMCQGEINQNFDRFKIGTIEDYIEKSKNKTGYLFETAIYGTMLLSGVEFNEENCKNFGLNIGIAFQIKDDLDNLMSDDFSKPQKNDLEEGIYTAPVIYAQDVNNYNAGVEKTIFLLDNYIEKSRLLTENIPQNEYTQVIKEYLKLQCGRN